jgi:hypothetical protein
VAMWVQLPAIEVRSCGGPDWLQHTLSPVLCSIVLGSTKHTAGTQRQRVRHEKVVVKPLQRNSAGQLTPWPGPVLLLYCPATSSRCCCSEHLPSTLLLVALLDMLRTPASSKRPKHRAAVMHNCLVPDRVL